jgi:hypothetical protein
MAAEAEGSRQMRSLVLLVVVTVAWPCAARAQDDADAGLGVDQQMRPERDPEPDAGAVAGDDAGTNSLPGRVPLGVGWERARAREAEVPKARVPPVVLFLAGRAGDHYEVIVDDQRCTTPCQLELPPGEHHIVVSGSESFTDTFELPPGGAAPVVIVKRHSGYLRAMAPVGCSLALTGALMSLISLPLEQWRQCTGDPCGGPADNPPMYNVLPLRYSGVALVAVGVMAGVLGFVGGGYDHVVAKDQRTEAMAPRIEAIGFAPMSRGAGVVAATISF